ncbi:hypothetical protein HNP86_001939 [Methanococcus maripaludis]|uniref:Uncharacterized protein n=1 Tax=Methanococcus maripaludis TaxID=39152 RepID=A0A7J9NVS3_METMI|nr:hypothetical protein [Methanococcus maripaludis]MBA2851780.1 hypothetical protein [Methanococcus maripaludis]
MVDKDIFSEAAREATIAVLSKRSVFYENTYKLPTINTLSYNHQIVLPKGAKTRMTDALSAGTAQTRAPKAAAINVDFHIQTFENGFKENKFQIKNLKLEDYLAQQVRVTNESHILDVDAYVLDKMKTAATAQAEENPWMAAGVIYPERIKAGLVKALESMTETIFFCEEKEDNENTVLYVPYSIKIGMKDYDSEFRSEKVLDMVKSYVKEVVFTKRLSTEAILAFKQDNYGTLSVEYDESPIIDYDDSSKTRIYYTSIIMMDCQVVPEDEAGKTKRIINLTSIL